MKILRAGLICVVGLMLGMLAFHSRRVSAQESGKVHVYIVPVYMLDARTPRPADLPGQRIAGISCLAKPSPKLPDDAVCYVATTLAGN